MINVIGFLLFILILIILIIMDRKNVKREGILLIRRTKKGRAFLNNVYKWHPKFWNILSYIAIIVGIPAMVVASGVIVNSLLGIILGTAKGAVKVVLPWAAPEAQVVTGALLVPWYFWVIGVFSVMVPHEAFHGVMSCLEKIKIKSLGWVLLIILPGAFVEPDEKKLKKSKTLTKLKVYGAGSFANFIMGALFFVIFTVFTAMFFIPGGVVPGGAIKGYPVAEANVSGAIIGINDVDINTVDDLNTTLSGIEPGEQIILRTTDGNYTIKTVEHPDQGGKTFIGISPPYQIHKVPGAKKLSPILLFFQQLFGWISLLNFGIGLVNMLPIKPLDGGLFLEAILEKYTEKSEEIIKYVSIILALVLVYSIVGGFFI